MKEESETAARRREVAVLLRDLAWTIHRRIPDLTGIDPLPSTELAVLKHILETPGMTVTELSRRMALKQSNTSAAVRVLTEHGLVTRESSPADRRISRLVPTAAALAKDEAIENAWAGPIRSGLAGLSAEEAEALDAAASALHSLNALLRSHQSG